MEIKMLSAEDRKKQPIFTSGVVLGKAGIGKTSLLYTLPAKKTLFINIESGDLSVRDWEGFSIIPNSWPDLKDLAAILGGGNPSRWEGQSYSVAHYDDAILRFEGDLDHLKKIKMIFLDSLTVACRLCLDWCEAQPEVVSDPKNGFKLWGLYGREMIPWLTQLQNIRDKHIWLIAILDSKYDEFSKKTIHTAQLGGGKPATEIFGIFDEVLIMTTLSISYDEPTRAFVCHAINDDGYPSKDRSTRLDLFEPPNLYDVIKKIVDKSAKSVQLKYEMKEIDKNE